MIFSFTSRWVGPFSLWYFIVSSHTEDFQLHYTLVHNYQFVYYFVNEFISRGYARVHHVSHPSMNAFNSRFIEWVQKVIRLQFGYICSATAQVFYFWLSVLHWCNGGSAVSRHINFRYNGDVAIGGVLQYVTIVLNGVKPRTRKTFIRAWTSLWD